jgi:hypothetical protein
MTQDSDELSFLLQNDWLQYRVGQIGNDQWVTVYSLMKNEREEIAIFSALIPNDRVSTSLNSSSWDLSLGGSMPGCTRYGIQTEDQVVYYRFGNDSGIEPLILYRSFHGIRELYIEVLEEFRLFHNLYFDRLRNIFLKFSDAGLNHEVIRITDASVNIRVKELRQFLAIKDMHLAILFEVTRFSASDIVIIPEEQRHINYSEGLVAYSFHASEQDFSSNPSRRIFSRSWGKKLIPGFSKEKSGIWPYNEAQPKQYEDFIVSVDENGDPIRHSSNPDRLANFFGANPAAPQYVTPVFFRRDVLTKYYSQSDKYSVEDGYLRCGGLWGLRMDNNHPKYVIVFLGDLGRDLSHEEQLYWKSFNILPDGTISNVSLQRNFMAEFAEPESIDLIFKHIFEQFQNLWYTSKGWYLFKPLNHNDEHLFISLRILLTNNQSEFDGQILAITKILIDSINEEEIEKAMEGGTAETKGISKLEKYLATQNFLNHSEHIKFLRNLQSLRSSGVGHRKGQNYDKIARQFGIGEKGLADVFENILSQAIVFIKALSAYFLQDDSY